MSHSNSLRSIVARSVAHAVQTGRRTAFVLALASAPLVARAGPALVAAPAAGADDAIVLPAPKDFAAAIAAVEAATGTEGEVIETEAGIKIPLSAGRAFALEPHVASRLLAGSHGPFRKAGIYLFRYERAYGLPGEKDRIGLMPTSDPDLVIRRMGTSGHRHGVTTEQIIQWLHALERDEAFELLEIGSDFVAGRFEREPKDPVALAHRAAKFAPDLVSGHSDPTAGLADLIGRKRTLFLIWD
ncbi:DUF4253 domain-containing protein [Anaeromyxobacter oryzae]|uniref:DUF4253 domain-containing protein n=1 Tax=Anaeromyxobacter oryzae TaxID=2918170 RepID=A0ABM7WRN9_9BACT|nr:DUF4253 domain-containing protein [Anaeromyxobacter oryzae]BDG02134.1 hypothetical protein AMOR_11300 [Anaeromyxobacter oryzae]